MGIRITPHRTGDGGILAMPMKKNIPVGHEDWKLTTCPICGAECWESALSRQVQIRETLEERLNFRLRELRKAYGDHDSFTDGFDDCVDRVENFPSTADVVEVVRCKDCLYAYRVDNREPKFDCRNICRDGCTQWLGSDDFCSYGERREDNEN